MLLFLCFGLYSLFVDIGKLLVVYGFIIYVDSFPEKVFVDIFRD